MGATQAKADNSTEFNFDCARVKSGRLLSAEAEADPGKRFQWVRTESRVEPWGLWTIPEISPQNAQIFLFQTASCWAKGFSSVIGYKPWGLQLLRYPPFCPMLVVPDCKILTKLLGEGVLVPPVCLSLASEPCVFVGINPECFRFRAFELLFSKTRVAYEFHAELL